MNDEIYLQKCHAMQRHYKWKKFTKQAKIIQQQNKKTKNTNEKNEINKTKNNKVTQYWNNGLPVGPETLFWFALRTHAPHRNVETRGSQFHRWTPQLADDTGLQQTVLEPSSLPHQPVTRKHTCMVKKKSDTSLVG